MEDMSQTLLFLPSSPVVVLNLKIVEVYLTAFRMPKGMK